ncbi:MAG: hypothetical protein K8953_11770 [Proteobacteria bacterium]|nr:hypothetical protein [Pseudomonadota bacterium]
MTCLHFKYTCNASAGGYSFLIVSLSSSSLRSLVIAYLRRIGSIAPSGYPLSKLNPWMTRTTSPFFGLRDPTGRSPNTQLVVFAASIASP